MDNKGFTLIEVMVSTMLLTGVTVGLYYLNLGMTKATLQHESMAVVRDDARLALQHMSRLLRMADDPTLVTLDGQGSPTALSTTTVDNIHFQPVDDTDANGVALSQDFSVGLANQMGFGVDTDDENSDGYTTTQLVQFDDQGSVVQVLTNNLEPTGGVSFARVAGGVQISLQLFRDASGVRPPVRTRLNQVVSVRN